eukprot:scaffold2408_cov44-Phaeocystis_antarctica.AAC.1
MVASVARPRRASAAARPMTRRVLAEGRTPRRIPGCPPYTGCCAACHTSSGSHRSGGQLRRGGCADTGASGGGG